MTKKYLIIILLILITLTACSNNASLNETLNGKNLSVTITNIETLDEINDWVPADETLTFLAVTWEAENTSKKQLEWIDLPTSSLETDYYYYESDYELSYDYASDKGIDLDNLPETLDINEKYTNCDVFIIEKALYASELHFMVFDTIEGRINLDNVE